MNRCLSRALKCRNAQSDRLRRSALTEWEGFEDSGEVREVFFFFSLLLVTLPSCGHTRRPLELNWHTGERGHVLAGSVGRGKGRVCCWSPARQQLSACRSGSVRGGRHFARLSTVQKHPETMQMGGGAAAPKLLPRVIFTACVYF